MVLQEIDADYIDHDTLVRLLQRKFGSNYSLGQRFGKWVVDIPERISKYEIERAQEED